MLRLKKWFLKKTPIQEKSQSALDGVEKIIPTQRINYCFSARRRRLMQGLWKSYARKAGYAKGIAFDDVVDSIGRLIKTVI